MHDTTGIGLLRWCLGQEAGYVAISTKHHRTRAWADFVPAYDPDDLSDIEQYIERKSRDSNVYFCPTVLNAPRCKKENITQSLVLWADLDACSPDEMLVPPTIVVETSKKRYQAYWKLHMPEPALDVQEVNRRIAYHHRPEGADVSGWDLTQRLRIPGTNNYKYIDSSPDTIVKIILQEYSREYSLDDFDMYPLLSGQTLIDIPMPEIRDDVTAEDLLNSIKGQTNLHPNAWGLFYNEPQAIGEGWSGAIWSLEKHLIAAGFSAEETFIICKAAACNKYARDNRPDEHLWKEIVKAQGELDGQSLAPSIEDNTIRTQQLENLYIPRKHLLTESERELAYSRKTFIEDYVDWGKEATDAPQEYHQAGAYTILSSILSSQIRIPTSGGMLLPNLWFMTLGETTLSRKTTCMYLAIDMLRDVDQECVLATDGSVEGIMDALATRPRRSSIYLKDEFSGFLEAVVKKDFLGGTLEHFTQLYDGHNLKRMLRSGAVDIRDPVFLLYCGGVHDRIYRWITTEHIASGFLPRFIYINPKVDMDRIRPLGPATIENMTKRSELVNRLYRINTHYNGMPSPTEDDDGNFVVLPKNWKAELKPESWKTYNRIANIMQKMAEESDVRDLMLPMMDRLSKSGLKMAVITAASERLDDEIVIEKNDIIHAFSYIERWIEHSISIITNAGKSADEKELERIVNWITDNPGVARGNIMQRFRLNSRIADGIFTTLLQRGLVSAQKTSTAQRFYPIRMIRAPGEADSVEFN